jgi:hypothetical protein
MSYLQNETIHETRQTDLGSAGPGSAALALRRRPHAGRQPATLQLEGVPANQPIVLVPRSRRRALPFKGGTLVPVPILLLVGGFVTDGAGAFSTPCPARPARRHT